MSVLMIAEKPSLAQSLSHILSNGNMKCRKSGACPVYEYRGSFLNHRDILFKFTSVCGHVFNADFEARFKNWDKSEPIELYDARIVRIEANPKMNMVKFLQREAKGCRYLVLWLDCDKEGENICFEIIDSLADVMPISMSNPQTVFRAHFSAITSKDIKEAFKKLRLPNKLEALSVTARQELDLIIGCSFTRYQTRFFHGKYGDLDSSLISYGPCQVPTLAFCVNRHDEIESFKPTPYWTLSAVVAPEHFSRQYLNIDWMGEREFNYGNIKGIYNQLKNVKEGKVISIKKTKKTTSKPKALNTVEMLKVASAKLGIGPHTAMQIAEKLYTQGYISYPRTETNQYPKNFDLMESLRIQTGSSTWGEDAQELVRTGISTPKSGHDAGDHPPITPMKCANYTDLSGEAWRMYDYIARHFMASLAPDMVHESTSIVIEIKSQRFQTHCSSVIVPGYTKFLPKGSSSLSEQNIPSSLKEGDKVLISEIKIKDHITQAPGYLTESELISLMEKHGIGTDASIPTHINNICLRNYVTIAGNRTLKPTKLGILLVHGYLKIDKELVLPTIRSDLEKELNLIAKGQVDFLTVLKKNIEYYRNKFISFMENIQLMDELFESSFTSLVDSGKPFSRCGKCKRFLKLITAKPERLVCPTCNETYNVPINGTIKTFKEVQCPLDGFDLLYFTGTKNFIFCPLCYNNPPFEDMTTGSGCIKCTNDQCQYSMISNSIGSCGVCSYTGTLVLDRGSGPPSWKIYCSKCNFTMSIFHDASKITLERDCCKTCQVRLIKLKYPESKTRLPKGLTEFKGCLWCSEELSSFVDAINNYSKTVSNQMNSRENGSGGDVHYGRGQQGRGRGGRGRGSRGGGGRGRGGGRSSRGRGVSNRGNRHRA